LIPWGCRITVAFMTQFFGAAEMRCHSKLGRADARS
jgi:hypothetical protein